MTDPGTEIEHVEVVDPAPRGMVVIVMARRLDFEPTMDWLLGQLAGTGADLQLLHAALVIITDIDGLAARVIKNEAEAGELLTMHKAALG